VARIGNPLALSGRQQHAPGLVVVRPVLVALAARHEDHLLAPVAQRQPLSSMSLNCTFIGGAGVELESAITPDMSRFLLVLVDHPAVVCR